MIQKTPSKRRMFLSARLPVRKQRHGERAALDAVSMVQRRIRNITRINSGSRVFMIARCGMEWRSECVNEARTALGLALERAREQLDPGQYPDGFLRPGQTRIDQLTG